MPDPHLRTLQPGDLGWVISRHGALYASEYGLDGSFEVEVAEIAAAIMRRFDPRSDGAWIAELNGAPVGSVFIVRSDETTAKLRLLIVDPSARGLGVGRMLSEAALDFARAAGYRRVTLWTMGMLDAARHIYAKAGFRMVSAEPARAFGMDVVNETWVLNWTIDLSPDLERLAWLRGTIPDFAEARSRAQADAAGVDAGALRLAGWFSAMAGEWTAAEQHLQSACEIAGQGGESQFCLGVLLLLEQRDHEALRAFQQAARLEWPGHDGERQVRLLAQAFAAGNRHAPFVEFYDMYDSRFCYLLACRKVHDSERQGYAFCMERLCKHIGRKNPVMVEVLAADFERNGSTSWYNINMGHFRWLNGDRDGADACYEKARTYAMENNVTPIHYNCGAMVWLSQGVAKFIANGLDLEAAEKPETGSGTLPADAITRPELVINVACDSNYFPFFPKMLLSLCDVYRASPHRRATAVHIFVADLSENDRQFLEAVARRLSEGCPGLSLSYSHGPVAHRERSYFTCLRFLKLADLLKSYSCGILTLDIDCIIADTFYELLPWFLEHQFAMRKYSFDESDQQVGDEPWSIGAHPLYVANTPDGRRFAGFLARYITAAYDPNLLTNWTIDQCAIAQGHALIARSTNVLNLAHLPAITHLPEEFGGKAAFLRDAAGLATGDFFDRLTGVQSALASG